MCTNTRLALPGKYTYVEGRNFLFTKRGKRHVQLYENKALYININYIYGQAVVKKTGNSCTIIQIWYSHFMLILAYLSTILLSLFSTAVMSYISIATPIGPWIAPTLALICLLIAHLLPQRIAPKSQTVALCIAGGSIGGILATAVGFYFPTFYFLDPELFNAYMAQPFWFCVLLSGITLGSALFGFMIASIAEEQLLITQKLPFAVGQMVHTMITTANQVAKACQLAIGFISTLLFCAAQKAIGGFGPLLPRCYTAVCKRSLYFFVIPRVVLRFDQLPMLLAIGFIAGHLIAVPLLIGVITRLGVAHPINQVWFPTVGSQDFIMAFCSGLVLFGMLASFYNMYMRWTKNKKKAKTKTKSFSWQLLRELLSEQGILVSAVVSSMVLVLILTGFAPVTQLFVLGATAVAAYQIMAIAGKIGLATMGRFATFVMVPVLLLFGATGLQATVISTFVGVAGGVGTDVLFGRKMGQLGNLSKSSLQKFQLLGLVVSSLSVGIIVWFLVSQFGLGSPELFAQRSQARALLINCTHFDFYVLGIGMVFGLLLKRLKANGLLVLGGLLMPIDYSLALIAGGFISQYLVDRQKGEPFWSGVFAANSIWMLLQALF